MMNKRKFASVAFTGAAVASLNTLPAAAASNTWAVTPGGAYRATGSGPVVVKDYTTGHSFRCAKDSIAGTLLKSATGSSAQIGTISNGNATSCSIVGVNAPKFPLDLSRVAQQWASHYSAPASHPKGVTYGRIKGIFLAWKVSTPFGTCSGVMSGSAPYKYVNSTGTGALVSQLSSHTQLRVQRATGCGSFVRTGDRLTAFGNYAVHQGQTITETPPSPHPTSWPNSK